MRRPLSSLVACLFALIILATGSLIPTPPALGVNTIGPTTTIGSTTTCGNTIDNTPGLGLICEVTVVNTITAGAGSATVTVRECHGAASDPEAACWTPPTTILSEPVTAVTMCNNSTWGGGSTLRCSVHVTNNFSGSAQARRSRSRNATRPARAGAARSTAASRSRTTSPT